ncbi:unnamed protein product [Caenorhabditis nigoni]
MIGFEWLEIQYRLITVLAFLSLFCNVILIILIYLKSPKKLGPYKHLMTFISIFEICYSIIDYLVVPVMHSYGTSFFIMTPLAHSLFEKPIALIMLGVWCAFYGSSMALFGIHFIYRYLAVSGDNLMQEFSLSVEDVIYMGPYFFNENGGFLFDTDVVMTLVGATSIMGTSLITIFFFGWKCYKALSDVTTSGGFSKQYRALQRQFFLALVLQTVIPITLMHLPLLITYSGALFNVGLGRMSSITSITIALYPVIDPLPSIFIIKNYRAGLKKFLMTPVKFCLAVKNKKAVNVQTDGTSSRRISKLPDDDNVSVWGEL